MTLRDLETQYADLTSERGTEFIKSIREAELDPGINTLQLIGYLEKIIDEFRPEGRRICSAGASMTQEDRNAITLQGRIIAALLLILQKTRSTEGLRDYILLFLGYASAVVRIKYDYLSTALDAICYKIKSLGLDWFILEETTSLDLLSYKLIEMIRFDNSVSDTFAFKGNGRVFCQDGNLSVCSSEALESGSKAFSICGDRISVFTRNVRDEKLKSADQYDAGALRTFADTFLRVQEEGSGKGAPKREYRQGDRVDVQLLAFSEDEESLECAVVDNETELRGVIIDEELVKGLWTGDLLGYFFERDCLRDAVFYKDADGNHFSIADAYTAFARRQAEKDFRDNVCFYAKAYYIDESWGRVNWMTPAGYAGITRLGDTPDVRIGDTRVLQVMNIQTQGPNTYINLCLPKHGYDEVRPFVEDDVLKDFVTTRENILRGGEKEKADLSDRGIDTIEALGTILSSTSFRGSSIDAYRHLLVALFLCEARGDGEEAERLRSESHYLGQCLSFAQGDRVCPDQDVVGLSGERASVLRLLSAWEDPKEEIGEELTAWGEGTLPGTIAGLIRMARIADEYRDEISFDRELVRKKICGLLGVADCFEAGGGFRRGKYGNVEGHEVEFKSSYVFRNDGKGADIEAQGKGQVFEAVCGFLNADGGVLYLGVNDQGNPILAKDRGLNADKAWLQAHRLQVNRDRFVKQGHSTVGETIGTEGDLDTFVQFLNGEKELYFKDAFWGNIRIVVTEDNDAIKIVVDPAKYELAYLYSDRSRTDGVAYVRDGGRTVPMSEVRKKQRLTDLKRIAKEMGFVVTIQEAIDRHQRLIFKDYASGNSGEVKDRYVIPINLFYNDENVYCYDLDSRKYKQFRLHRIGAIEPGEDTSPYPLPRTEPRTADVFRWILPEGERSYHVRLRMNVAARNYLLEEYSCAEKLPAEEFYEETKNHWILDTRVNGLGAVRRFYLGMADKIEILDTEDSEELKKDILDYLKKNIKLTTF